MLRVAAGGRCGALGWGVLEILCVGFLVFGETAAFLQLRCGKADILACFDEFEYFSC